MKNRRVSWQPIETYPAIAGDEGPEVLLYDPTLGIVVGSGHWYDPETSPITFYYDRGWDCNPTHWMPLPEPPENPKFEKSSLNIQSLSKSKLDETWQTTTDFILVENER